MMSQRVAASVDQPRFATTVLATFALLALALASVGLYGVLSYGVSQRRRELGLRAALGAARPELVRQVIREGLTVTVVGLLCGLAGAAALTRLMAVCPVRRRAARSRVFRAGARAAHGRGGRGVLLPAARAASTDPADALRCE